MSEENKKVKKKSNLFMHNYGMLCNFTVTCCRLTATPCSFTATRVSGFTQAERGLLSRCTRLA